MQHFLYNQRGKLRLHKSIASIFFLTISEFVSECSKYKIRYNMFVICVCIRACTFTHCIITWKFHLWTIIWVFQMLSLELCWTWFLHLIIICCMWTHGHIAYCSINCLTYIGGFLPYTIESIFSDFATSLKSVQAAHLCCLLAAQLYIFILAFLKLTMYWSNFKDGQVHFANSSLTLLQQHLGYKAVVLLIPV